MKIAIIGKSNTGKTTFMSKLFSNELKTDNIYYQLKNNIFVCTTNDVSRVEKPDTIIHMNTMKSDDDYDSEEISILNFSLEENDYFLDVNESYPKHDFYMDVKTATSSDIKELFEKIVGQ